MKKLTVFTVLALSVMGVFAQQRIPLIEDFSSSTCPPCKTFDENVFYPFLLDKNNQGKFISVSYRMNWPGSGDPYYTEEAGTRRRFYEVNSVPRCYIDAQQAPSSSLSAFTSSFNSAYNNPSKAEMTAIYSITGDSPSNATVAVKVTVTSTENITGINLYIAVVEKKTTGNIGTNGETEFYDVMMKMVPDASGTSMTLNANIAETVIKEASLSGTNIEEISDLEVVAWIQRSGNKEVLQSVFSVEDITEISNNNMIHRNNSIIVYLNPILKTMVFHNAENATILIYNVFGKQIARFKSINNVFNIDIAHQSQGCYILKMMKDNARYSRLIHIIK